MERCKVEIQIVKLNIGKFGAEESLTALRHLQVII
jgi:hypothetical protein